MCVARVQGRRRREWLRSVISTIRRCRMAGVAGARVRRARHRPAHGQASGRVTHGADHRRRARARRLDALGRAAGAWRSAESGAEPHRGVVGVVALPDDERRTRAAISEARSASGAATSTSDVGRQYLFATSAATCAGVTPRARAARRRHASLGHGCERPDGAVRAAPTPAPTPPTADAHVARRTDADARSPTVRRPTPAPTLRRRRRADAGADERRRSLRETAAGSRRAIRPFPVVRMRGRLTSSGANVHAALGARAAGREGDRALQGPQLPAKRWSRPARKSRLTRDAAVRAHLRAGVDDHRDGHAATATSASGRRS